MYKRQVQTHASIRKNFLEETCEALEAIDADDPVMMQEELGDVLMQVAVSYTHLMCIRDSTPTTLTDLTAAFGEEVAALVDGVTKLTKIQFAKIEELQAENLRKMLLAMSRDVRVMIIKLCDRLHNMRTGDAWPEQKLSLIHISQPGGRRLRPLKECHPVDLR